MIDISTTCLWQARTVLLIYKHLFTKCFFCECQLASKLKLKHTQEFRIKSIRSKTNLIYVRTSQYIVHSAYKILQSMLPLGFSDSSTLVQHQLKQKSAIGMRTYQPKMEELHLGEYTKWLRHSKHLSPSHNSGAKLLEPHSRRSQQCLCKLCLESC